MAFERVPRGGYDVDAVLAAVDAPSARFGLSSVRA
jgi:hypothetical protein